MIVGGALPTGLARLSVTLREILPPVKGASRTTGLDTGAPIAARRCAIEARRSTMLRTVTTAVCGAVLAVCGPALAVRPGSTLQPSQRFSCGTELVRVDVLVSAGGRLVSGLTAKDFEVRDRGVLQQLGCSTSRRWPLT